MSHNYILNSQKPCYSVIHCIEMYEYEAEAEAKGYNTSIAWHCLPPRPAPLDSPPCVVGQPVNYLCITVSDKI